MPISDEFRVHCIEDPTDVLSVSYLKENSSIRMEIYYPVEHDIKTVYLSESDARALLMFLSRHLEMPLCKQQFSNDTYQQAWEDNDARDLYLAEIKRITRE